VASIFAGLTEAEVNALTPAEVHALVDKSLEGRVWISRYVTYHGIPQVGEARAVPEADLEKYLAAGWHLVTPESGD
jgi:hypothetical protein